MVLMKAKGQNDYWNFFPNLREPYSWLASKHYQLKLEIKTQYQNTQIFKNNNKKDHIKANVLLASIMFHSENYMLSVT